MKTTMLGYEEVKGLLLQGYEVKLPEWQGYWKMNEKQDGIEVHTKDGRVLDTPHIMYTFHNNWEIATVDNCPVLKKEKSKDNGSKGFEIIDMDIINIPFIGQTPVIVRMKDGETKPTVMKITDFEEMVGGRVEAMRLTKEFTMSSIPEEARELFSFIDNKLEEIINLAEELENEEETEEDEEECDCPICRGEIDEDDIMMIGKIIEDITGGAIRFDGIEVVRG